MRDPKQDLKRRNFERRGFKRSALMIVSGSLMSLGLLANGSTLGIAAPTADIPPLPETAPPAEAVAVPGNAVVDDDEAEAVRVVLRLGDRRVFLFQGETVIDSYPVAVGATDTPTPQGQFKVSKLVIEPVWQSPWTGEMHAPGPNSALGLRWIGFFADDSGAFGFHGTPTLDSIGKAASNGCVRLRNEDIVALFSQVTIGTPVEVVP